MSVESSTNSIKNSLEQLKLKVEAKDRYRSLPILASQEISPMPPRKVSLPVRGPLFPNAKVPQPPDDETKPPTFTIRRDSSAQRTPIEISVTANIKNENPDYYDHLMALKSRSTLFIRLGSDEVVWRETKPIKLIGSYMLGGLMGRGAFGKVKEGFHAETLERVAIKILCKKRVRRTPNGIANVLREISLLRKLKHKNVIKLLDVYCKLEPASEEDQSSEIVKYTHDIREFEQRLLNEKNSSKSLFNGKVLSKWYIVFEFCSGTMENLLNSYPTKKLPMDTAQKLFRQLMMGLEFLSSRSVVHRDIKPANLLINADGVLKIIDFGVAEELSCYVSTLKCNNFAGTHHFMSPQVVLGEESEGEKIDVWAAGVTLYNIAFGSFPFTTQDDDIMFLHDQIVNTTETYPKDCDGDLIDLLKGMLHKNPIKRFSTSQVIGHTWLQKQVPAISYSTVVSRSASRMLKEENAISPYHNAIVTKLTTLFGDELEMQAKLKDFVVQQQPHPSKSKLLGLFRR